MSSFELKKYLQILTEAESYSTLADAGDAYSPGNTEIWYWKGEHGRDFMMGYDFMKKHSSSFDPNNLSQTHVLVGKIAETDPNKIFSMMQGESWSPRGEARDMIEKLGVEHTSMSVGDVIRVNNDMFMVDRMGFRNLATGEEA